MNKTSFTTSLLVVLTALTLVSGAALAQTWDGGTATNNDDGGTDSSAYSDSTTPSGDSSSDTTSSDSSDGWDGGTASNDDDGTSTSKDGWNGETSTNEDDGSSTTWDGETASNNNDGDGDGTSWEGGTATNNDDGGGSASTEDSSTSSTSSSGGGGSSDFTWNPSQVSILDPGIRFDLSPSPANVGDTVTVSGTLQHSTGIPVSVMLDGQKVGETRADSDGAFSTSFSADEIGQHTVTLKARDETAQKQLNVNPTVSVSNLNSRVTYNSAANVMVCGDVASETTPNVKLVRNGNTLESKNQKGRVCFNPSLSDGTHELTMVGEVEGNTDEARTTVTVRSPSSDVETENNSVLASILQPLFQLFAGIFEFLARLVPG